jgi:hypothetical protein
MLSIPELAEKLVHQLFPALYAIQLGSDTFITYTIRRSGSGARTIVVPRNQQD